MVTYKLKKFPLSDLKELETGLQFLASKGGGRWQVHSWNLIREGTKYYGVFLLEKSYIGEIGVVANQQKMAATIKELKNEKDS